jgi:hypothetical protein
LEPPAYDRPAGSVSAVISGTLISGACSGVTEALIRLRAHAFSNDRPLAEVAHDVIARKLRLP